MRLQLSDLIYLSPELTLVIAAVVISVLDLVLPNKINRTILGWLSILSLMISAGFVLYYMRLLNLSEDPLLPVELLNLSYRVDDFANLFKLIFLVGTIFVLFMSIGSIKKEEIQHRGEYYYLFLPATLGAMIMASSGDLITLYVGLELLSITSYILVGIKKSSVKSNEASFKYVVIGGIASAFILYGMSFLYGMTGSTNLTEINQALQLSDGSFALLIYVSFFLIIAGLGTKIAAAPFHAWAADVYQGAATPVTAYLATVSKAAGFAMIFRLVYLVYLGVGGQQQDPIFLDFFMIILIIAASAMIIGNTLALKQRNMKRLLAYSGVANAGYLLVPIGIGLHSPVPHSSNFSEMYFYLIAYLFMNLGAFAVLMAIERTTGNSELKGFAGLYYRAPFTAFAFVIILLSLAGLPVTGGFIGKVFILLGALQVKVYWIAIIMILTSVISFYYYFSVIRQMFMRTNFEASTDKLNLTTPISITIWISTAITVLLGFFPNYVISYVHEIFNLFTDFLML
ncbi:NADH-quinone oxidoreductase subunit N [Chengkuizengella axinellae]|uniref:NADH-quinone oxidoreductase subunit N n=1 Tax=Chengkuizengella axinellae TaxID=3064388 RepID=A0ABT9J744_9BACL|nr:NADH-quinone oxidoreductase subunit N [Chengkuizengella sp. 2205SS18-9]MDP5276840.1 NADH-quinone oxidoreductase subunit N [Chengkuizengella sp. 2205SS18-9]